MGRYCETGEAVEIAVVWVSHKEGIGIRRVLEFDRFDSKWPTVGGLERTIENDMLLIIRFQDA